MTLDTTSGRAMPIPMLLSFELNQSYMTVICLTMHITPTSLSPGGNFGKIKYTSKQKFQKAE